MVGSEVEPLDLWPILRRRMVWDIVPCPDQQEFIAKLGMLPASEGGDRLEHSASHRRISRLLPVREPLQLLAGVAAEVAGRAILDSQGIDIETDLAKHYLEHYIHVSIATTVAVVASLVDYEILEVSEEYVDE